MASDTAISIPETTWQTETLDADRIQDEISYLWDRVNANSSQSVPAPSSRSDTDADDDVVSARPANMHATTFNLIAVASSDAEAEFIKDTVAQLRDFLPSRTIVLVMGNEPTSDTAVYDISVALREQRRSTTSELHFETITIATDVREIGRLASLVTPLLMPELPGYLWWPVDSLQARPLFFDLAEIVDRLVIDSAPLGADLRNLPLLRALSDPEATQAILGDFTWLRLGTWRNLIAQFFDPEDVQDSLNSISEVHIAYAGPRADGSSGLPAALLAVGWLASRLEWEVIEPLDTNKAGVSWAPLRTRGTGGRQRDIQVRLTPDNSPHARFSLRRVELIATGDAPGVFRVERTDDDDLVTSSETPSVPFVSRMVYSKRPENATMLHSEVQRLSRDRVYEEALRTAVKLLP